jgi:hypothetical protein
MKKINTSLVLGLLSVSFLYGCENKVELNAPRNLRVIERELVWEVDLLNVLPDFLITINDSDTKKVSFDALGFGVNRLSLDFITTNGEYNFKVQSVTTGLIDGLYKNSTVIEQNFIITVLQSISFLSYNLGTQTVEWNQINGNNGYEISIDGQLYTTSINQYPLSRKEIGAYIVKVRALGDKGTTFDSTFSSESQFRFLPRPVNVSRNGLSISWTSVENASSYRIFNNLSQIGESTNNSFLIPNFINGNLSITVIAIGNNVTFFDSVMSDPLQFTVL